MSEIILTAKQIASRPELMVPSDDMYEDAANVLHQHQLTSAVTLFARTLHCSCGCTFHDIADWRKHLATIVADRLSTELWLVITDRMKARNGYKESDCDSSITSIAGCNARMLED